MPPLNLFSEQQTTRKKHRKIFQLFCIIALAVLGIQLGLHQTSQVESKTRNVQAGKSALVGGEAAGTSAGTFNDLKKTNKTARSARSGQVASELSSDLSGESSHDFGETWMAGKVVKVSDGDTVQVLVENDESTHKTLLKIRLAGIDAPEKKQPFGNRAREALAKMVAGQTVSVEVFGQDRYGRTLGRLWIGKTDVNAHLVAKGWVWYYRQFKNNLPDTLQEQFDEAENNAKMQKWGLWSDKNPVAPWEFRKSLKQGVAQEVVQEGEKEVIQKDVQKTVKNKAERKNPSRAKERSVANQY